MRASIHPAAQEGFPSASVPHTATSRLKNFEATTTAYEVGRVCSTNARSTPANWSRPSRNKTCCTHLTECVTALCLHGTLYQLVAHRTEGIHRCTCCVSTTTAIAAPTGRRRLLKQELPTGASLHVRDKRWAYEAGAAAAANECRVFKERSCSLFGLHPIFAVTFSNIFTYI